MTIDELNLIDEMLETGLYMAINNLDIRNFKKAKAIIEKEMNCTCPKSSNPACNVHGVNASLSRGME